MVRHGVRMTSLGIALGLAGALAATRLLRGLVVAVSPTDPVVFGSVTVAIAIIAAVAHLIPVRDALRIDPASAMRAA
jgi:ABC-type antimicrobial peptide transport system permease subunit